jgi:drug/metabolite transporter (DMT)-like permease
MRFRAIVPTAAAMVCFAANSILCRLALAPNRIDAATFTTVRVVSAAAMLSLVIALRRRQFPRMTRVNPFSATALFGYLAFFSFAYTQLDAGSGALILIGAVEFTMLTIAFREGERFTRTQWAGLIVAVLGFVYLVLPGAGAPDALGAVLMIISGVSWGLFSLLARGAHDPLEANAANFLCCLLPAVLVNLVGMHQIEVTSAGLALAAASGAIATGLGYLVWYLALRHLPAAHAATVQLSMPALVALGGIIFLAEPLTARLVAASVAMLGGVALVLRQRIEKAAP